EAPPGPPKHLGAGSGRLLGSFQRVHRHPLRGSARLRAKDRARRRSGDLPRRGQPASPTAFAPRGNGRWRACQPAREDEGHEQSDDEGEVEEGEEGETADEGEASSEQNSSEAELIAEEINAGATGEF